MTLSKRQRVIIWSFVIFTVIMLGFGKSTDISKSDNFVMDNISFYKIGISHRRQWSTYRQATFRTITDNSFDLLSRITDEKYVLIFVSALIGATLLITSRTK